MPLEIQLGHDGLPVMSRSGLEASLCGFRYNALYNEGVQDDSPFSHRGTAFHKVSKRYIKRLAAANVPMDHEEAVLAFEEGIAEAMTPPQLIPEVREIYDRHVNNFALDLERYVAAEHKRVRVDAAVPYQFEPDLEYVDYTRSEVEIIDWKSYYRDITEAQAKALFQTRFYIWCAMQEFTGFQTYRFTYGFPRLNCYTSVVYDVSEFAELDREIRAWEAARRQRYAMQRWETNPGEPCAFCHLNCPERTNERKAFVSVTDDASFKDVAGARVVLEKVMKDIDASLKAYVNVNGPQNVNGEVFDFRPSVAKSYPMANAVDAIRASGREPLAFVSASALKADFKLHGQTLTAALSPVVRAKETKRFGHKSLKADMQRLAAGEDYDADSD